VQYREPTCGAEGCGMEYRFEHHGSPDSLAAGCRADRCSRSASGSAWPIVGRGASAARGLFQTVHGAGPRDHL